MNEKQVGRRERLIRACETQDYTEVKNLGWLEIYNALRDWFGGRPLSMFDFTAYADLLGDEDPDGVMDAVRVRAKDAESGFRPKPAELYQAVQGARAKESQHASAERRARGDKPSPDQLPEVLARVRQLMEEGDRACNCDVRQVHMIIEELDGRVWTSDELRRWQSENRSRRARDLRAHPLPPHVIRCRRCHGIEQGQVYAAEDDVPDFTLPAA